MNQEYCLNCKEVVEPTLEQGFVVCPTCGQSTYNLTELGGAYQSYDRAHRKSLRDIATLFGVMLDDTQSTHVMEDELRVKLKEVKEKREAALTWIHWAGHMEDCHIRLDSPVIRKECTCGYQEIVGDE